MKEYINILCTFFLCLGINTIATSQELPEQGSQYKSRLLNIILDDTYILGGLSRSGIYYSNHFRNLSYAGGYQLGIEQYIPVAGKLFISTGFTLANRPLSHRPLQNLDIKVNNLYFDLPVHFAYELPVFRHIDFRFILGLFGSTRVSSWIDNSYPSDYINGGSFLYRTEDFKRFDFGWIFGLSIEVKDYLIRVRSLSGWNNLTVKDQGMINGFNIEIGYFLFRKK